MNFVSQTEQQRSLEDERMLWEAERQLLLHQLENERRAHQAACDIAARRHKVQNAALEREIFHLRMALAHAKQYTPQVYMDIPCPQLSSESASSSPSSTQSMTAAIVPVASARPDTHGLDYATFIDSPVLGNQNFNDPSTSSPLKRDS